MSTIASGLPGDQAFSSSRACLATFLRLHAWCQPNAARTKNFSQLRRMTASAASTSTMPSALRGKQTFSSSLACLATFLQSHTCYQTDTGFGTDSGF